jgi:hypothetical protein
LCCGSCGHKSPDSCLWCKISGLCIQK